MVYTLGQVSRNQATCLAFGLILICLGSGCRHSLPAPPAGVSVQDYERADEALRLSLGRAPTRNELDFWIGERALRSQRPEVAAAALLRIPLNDPALGLTSRVLVVDLYRAQSRGTECERLIRQALSLPTQQLEQHPELHDQLRRQLRNLLEVSLRFEERHRLLRPMQDSGRTNLFEVRVACFPMLLRWNGPNAFDWVKAIADTCPDDPVWQVAVARHYTSQGRPSEAQATLEKAVAADSTNRRAISALVEYWQNQGDQTAADQLIEQVASPAETDPWLLCLQRGHWHLRNKRLGLAEVEFQRVLDADNSYAQAWVGMAAVAGAKPDLPQREHALKMVGGLARIQNYIGKVSQDDLVVDGWLQIALAAQELGLTWQAQQFAQVVLKLEPTNDSARAILNEVDNPIRTEPQTPLKDAP